MANKFATTKYRKRRKREKLNAIAREKRIKALEREHWVEVRKRRQQAEEARLRDPRRPHIQRIVNILDARCMNDPLYRIREIMKVFGVDTYGLIDSVVAAHSGGEGEDSNRQLHVPMPPMWSVCAAGW